VTPELIPVLSLLAAVLGGIFGAWVGVKTTIVRLETQMEDVRARVEGIHKRLHRHNDTLLIHDGEIEQALNKLEIKRLRRQTVLE
jgi:hypothetical protein